MRTLRSFDKNTKLLVIVDELSIMLNLFRDNSVGDEETRAFLYWFRQLRIDPKIGLTNCRFLIGGSIGIDHYLSQLGASHSFNDFERVPLGELSAEQASEFLKQLLDSRRLSLNPTVRKKILDLIGAPIPYFIQVFVSEIAAEQVSRSQPIGPKSIDNIYQYRLLSAACKTYFQHYYNRLGGYDKPEEKAAKALLKALALAQPGFVPTTRLRTLYRGITGESATDDRFARLISNLENDFYIRYHSEQKGYAFASKILCDWWRRYYAF